MLSQAPICIQKQLSENLLIGLEQYLVEAPYILWEILKTTMWVEIALWPQGKVSTQELLHFEKIAGIIVNWLKLFQIWFYFVNLIRYQVEAVHVTYA